MLFVARSKYYTWQPQETMDNSPKPKQTFAVTIDNCDKEQIHIPGSVQSFGALIGFDSQHLITRVSENIESLIGQKAVDLLGKPLGTIMEDREIAKLESIDNDTFFSCVSLQLKAGGPMTAVAHATNGESYIDIVRDPLTSKTDFFPVMREMASEFSAAANEQQLAQIIADKVRFISGFDRVKVYKFDAEWNGAVIAEARKSSMPSYKGLHFPASDIPKQARELYIRNRLRVIADVNDPQSPLVERADLKPLDMSFSFVRSVSPIHLQYLRNMDVAASMSISLFERNRFWGLIACHNEKPRAFNLHEATLFYSLSEFCSNRLTDLYRMNAGEQKEAYLSIIQDLVSNFNRNRRIESLIQEKPAVDDLIISTGNAVVLGKSIVKKNAAPDDSTLHGLIAWLERGGENVFACDDLPSRYGESIGSYACGLLAAKIPNVPRSWILWFKLEITTEVEWAGDPFKPTEDSPFGARLYPRTSFELWKENRKGHSSPWQPWELEAAHFLAKMLGPIAGADA